MKKRIISWVLLFLFILSAFPPVQVHAEKGEAFTGTRTVTFTADWSDLANYIDGGRPAFDMVLRVHIPQWAHYSIRTQGRDVQLSVWYDFESQVDYEAKTAGLILRSLALVCEQEDGLLMLENCTSFELLNFLNEALKTNESLGEKALDEIFTLKESTILVNGKTYELEDSVCIYPDGMKTVRMDYLSIETETRKNNSYSRTITARINTESGSSKDADALKKQFSHCGKVKVSKDTENFREISVTFEALSTQELEQKTMLCLNAPTFIREEHMGIDGKLVFVERTEFVELGQLLREEGTFHYAFLFPSYWENPGSYSSDVTVSEHIMNANNTSYIVCSYERDFQFDTIEVRTDLSNLLGKIQRTIICTAPADLAAGFHKNLKEKLELNLVNGAVLDIYDEAGTRYYTISYASWRLSDINNFTTEILKSSDCAMEIQTSWVPFGSWEITDSYNLDRIISHTVPADQMTATYILSDLAFPDKSLEEAEHVTVQDNSISFRIRSGSQIQLPYRQIQVVRCSIILVGVLFLLILVLTVIRKIKGLASKSARRKTNAAPQPVRTPPVQTPAPRTQSVIYCYYCGEKNMPEDKFCNQCGRKLTED